MRALDSTLGSFKALWEPIFRPPDAVLPEHCQAFAVHVEVRQGEVRAQPVVVLRDASIAHLVEAEDALHDAERMLHLGAHARLTPVLLFL